MDNDMFSETTTTVSRPVPNMEQAKNRLADAQNALKDAEEEVRAAREKSGEELSSWLKAAATQSLAQAERKRNRAVQDVAQATDAIAQAQAKENQPSPSVVADHNTTSLEQEPGPVYATSEEFLIDQLLPMYIRIIDSKNGTWCRKWYLHAEALSRVDALWRAWEHFRLDGKTGMSVWWRDHADPHMAVLLNQKGPFHECDLETHKDPDPLPCDTAPPGWFPKEGDIPFP